MSVNDGDAGAVRTLEALAQRLQDIESVVGAAVHDECRPWIELVAQRPLRPAVLREIADHACAINETAVDDGIIMATVRLSPTDKED